MEDLLGISQGRVQCARAKTAEIQENGLIEITQISERKEFLKYSFLSLLTNLIKDRVSQKVGNDERHSYIQTSISHSSFQHEPDLFSLTFLTFLLKQNYSGHIYTICQAKTKSVCKNPVSN